MNKDDVEVLAEPLFKFISEDCFLKLSKAEDFGNVLVIKDIKTATRIAHDQVFTGDEADFMEWRSLTQQLLGEIMANLYDLPDGFQVIGWHSDVITRLGHDINQALTPRGYWNLIDDVLDDFSGILYAKIEEGLPEAAFFRRLFEIYLAGGWPCGWKGEYPQGQLVVFVDENGNLAV